MGLHCGGCSICLIFVFLLAAYFVAANIVEAYFHNSIFDTRDNGVATTIYHLICSNEFRDVLKTHFKSQKI